jgi:magnesium transporter
MIDPLDLAHYYIERHPADAARTLETLTPARTSEFLLAVDDKQITLAVAQLTPDYAAACIPFLPFDRKLSLFKHLDTQVTVDIFRYLNNKEKYGLLYKLPLSKRLAIQTLNKYNLNSCGAWMSTDYFSVREDKTVAEVIELIQTSDLANQDYVFVVNTKRQFLFTINTSQLLKTGLGAQLRAVGNPATASLPARATVQEVQEFGAWKHYTVLPVVEHDNRLVGALSYNDLMAAFEKSQLEFAARTADVGDEALSLFWALFNNSIQLLNDFYAILMRKN